MKLSVLTAATAALVLASCSQEPSWSVNGTIAGADGKTLVLESVNNGVWSPLDSLTLPEDGAFVFEQLRAAFPDIYRLSLDGKSVYFPVDSTENITVQSVIDAFDSQARISGSASAEIMQRINDRVAQAVMQGGERAIAANDSLKRDIARMIQADWSGIAAYYAVNKTVGRTPLFDPSRNLDRRIINAVANGFSTLRPDDPRTAMLRNNAEQIQRLYGAGGTSIEAELVPFIDISYKNAAGKTRTLSEEWAKGKTIVLNFTRLTQPEAAPYNIVLNKVYEKFKDNGVEIFQVSLEDDEFAWAAAAKNLPWITVVAPSTGDITQVMAYGITDLPTTFVISRSGNNMERVESADDLERAVSRNL